ncbi:MAG: hypothetical protein WD696_00840 [Bryobacteraceae bacterium]
MAGKCFQLRHAALVLSYAVFCGPHLNAGKFFPDDPISKEPPPLRVGKVKPVSVNDQLDVVKHMFRKKAGQPAEIPAQNVNTLGEVPDGPWYENRFPSGQEELTRGSCTANAPRQDAPWTVIQGEMREDLPELSIRDGRGNRYTLKFDPASNPEMATGAEVIGSRFFHALGYHVPESYLVSFDRGQLSLGPESVMKPESGLPCRMLPRDLNDLMRRAQVRGGAYRAVAILQPAGETLGPFRFDGTRLDDPNDITPHEHRRELRGLYVFSSWLNHDNMRANATADVLVDEPSSRYVKHFLTNFSSVLGSGGARSNEAHAGNEYGFDFRAAARQLLTFGMSAPPWARAEYPKLLGAGRFESEYFNPEQWKPLSPNPAFLNRLPDDMFWAARKVMRFDDDQIRTLVRCGEFSNPETARWIADTLIARRDKIGRTYFSKVLPLDQFRIENRRLAFDDLAVRYRFAQPRSYSVQWWAFDNESGRKTEMLGATGPELPDAEGYLLARIQTPGEEKSALVYVNCTRNQELIVGIEHEW